MAPNMLYTWATTFFLPAIDERDDIDILNFERIFVI